MNDTVRSMTVCIAAMAENGKKIITGTDNTLTHTIGGSITYEIETPTNKKLVKINDNIVAMGAGATDNIAVVINEAKKKIHANTSPKKATEEVANAFASFVKESAEQAILIPVGLTWTTFTNNQNKLDPAIARDLYDRLQKHSPVGEILVAGFDQNTKEGYIAVVIGAQIFDRNTLGIGFAGGGMGLAQFSTLKSAYRKDMLVEEVTKIVTEAITDSAHATGVGGISELEILGATE